MYLPLQSFSLKLRSATIDIKHIALACSDIEGVAVSVAADSGTRHKQPIEHLTVSDTG